MFALKSSTSKHLSSLAIRYSPKLVMALYERSNLLSIFPCCLHKPTAVSSVILSPLRLKYSRQASFDSPVDSQELLTKGNSEISKAVNVRVEQSSISVKAFALIYLLPLISMHVSFGPICGSASSTKAFAASELFPPGVVVELDEAS